MLGYDLEGALLKKRLAECSAFAAGYAAEAARAEEAAAAGGAAEAAASKEAEKKASRARRRLEETEALLAELQVGRRGPRVGRETSIVVSVGFVYCVASRFAQNTRLFHRVQVDSAESRAAAILAGLQFSHEMMNAPLAQLSGARHRRPRCASR